MHTTTHTPERERVPWVGRTGHSKKERAARAPRRPGPGTQTSDATARPSRTAREPPPPHAVSQLQLPSDCPTQFCNGKIRGGHTCSAPADLHEATCHMISQGQARTRLCTHPVQLYTAYTLVRYTVNVTIAAIVCMHHAAPTVSRISRVRGSFERRCSRAAGRVRA